MSRRRLFTLFAVLLMLCASLSGAARAAVTAVNVVGQVADACCMRQPSGECASMADLSMAADSDGTVELADVPLLPGSTPSLPLCLGEHRLPRPVLHAGHPAPCLDGLLRPPSWCG
ncbi:hypothetical protein [Sphaerotilus sp.]|uniref:hypothetical protein n=1 Tax=Sphaerotilus sp. TaxID=2093942 RepID=UPI0034E2DD0E